MGMATDFFKKLPKIFSKIKEALINFLLLSSKCLSNKYLEYSWNCCNYSLNKYFKIACILKQDKSLNNLKDLWDIFFFFLGLCVIWRNWKEFNFFLFVCMQRNSSHEVLEMRTLYTYVFFSDYNSQYIKIIGGILKEILNSIFLVISNLIGIFHYLVHILCLSQMAIINII